MKNTLILLALFVATFAQSQTLIGTWKTVDDETGEAKSHIEIYQANGKYYGKIVQLLLHAPDRRCKKCPGERKDQLLMGMVLLENMELKKGMLQGGKILDPEKGKWYSCKMWLREGKPNELAVRGYIGPFYRTQTWFRVN